MSGQDRTSTTAPIEVHGSMVFERYKPRRGEVPGGYVGYCIRICVCIGSEIRVSNLIHPEALTSASLWAFGAEMIARALEHLESHREQVRRTEVLYGGATKHCQIVHAEGYIYEHEETVAGKRIKIRQPAIRIVIEIAGGRIIPCTDALPEPQSVNDWAQGFSEIVAEKVMKSGGRVDPSALRSEFVKIARDAIKAIDRLELSKLKLPVLH